VEYADAFGRLELVRGDAESTDTQGDVIVYLPHLAPCAIFFDTKIDRSQPHDQRLG
jgi:hypothetical protein